MGTTSTKHYWGYRISTVDATYFWKELQEGRLRQGWGYDEKQDLRNHEIDKGASGNLRMLKVKKGDILLVAGLHLWDEITIVEATEDWQVGYRFDIEDGIEEYGHIFPIRFIRSIKRHSPSVADEIRSSFHCHQRFWNMDPHKKAIEELLAI